MKKILFLHHGVGISGADYSLLYLMRGLEKHGVACVVGSVQESESALRFFQREGFQAFQSPARFFRHTTGGWYPTFSPSGIRNLASWGLQYRRGCQSVRRLVESVNPTIVHLNSLTLAPYLPVIRAIGVPTVVHVRERVHPGTFGFRKQWLKQLILRHASAVIYICKDNRDHLTGEHQIGKVIYNPVDFDKFDRHLDKHQARQKIGVTSDANIILYLGGSGLEIKGIFPFLESLKTLKQRHTQFTCVMLGTHVAPDKSFRNRLLRGSANMFGVYSLRQKIERLISEYGLSDHVMSLPFKRNAQDYYAASDIVAVPFTAPHFARQVIEAGAMARPVVASKIGGIEEVVVNHKTGLLVPPGDARALADAFIRLLGNPEMAREMGDSAYQIAKHAWDMEVSVKQVIETYDEMMRDGGAKNKKNFDTDCTD